MEPLPKLLFIDTILHERQTTHGDFTDNAEIMQATKELWHTNVGWDRLDQVKREALDMIAHKVGRILTGDPNAKDHWDDIAGYAVLASSRVKSEQSDTLRTNSGRVIFTSPAKSATTAESWARAFDKDT